MPGPGSPGGTRDADQRVASGGKSGENLEIRHKIEKLYFELFPNLHGALNRQSSPLLLSCRLIAYFTHVGLSMGMLDVQPR